MAFSRIPLLLALSHVYQAASEQPSAPSPIAAPLRELPFGQLNFLHTTDTHGWFGGHLQEAQYAADWGDYISFAHHLRKRADEDGSDLLLIDTGDRVEGNGLYDASTPKGRYTVDIIKQQDINVVISGNHELYIANTSNREYEEVVPGFKNSYIASNLDIHDPDSKDGNVVPLAQRFRKFTTKNQGIRILSFGFMFNFHGNANNTVLQPVEETIKEQWFKDAIRDKEVDLFLVAGHIPVRDSVEFDQIYKAIREAQWDTPIVFFGGHTHVRDYRKWESKAYGIESGRYMETLGFLSISGLKSGGKKNSVSDAAIASPDYKRMYIDNNLFSLYHHSKTNSSTFDTGLGKNVSATIHDARKSLKLDHTFGCAPHDYWLNRAPYPSDNSMLTWVEEQVLPDTFGPESNSTESIIITNSGALRFDIFKGPFTTDTTFLVSPFTSSFRKITKVPFEAASQVLRILNNEGQIPLKDLLALSGEPGWGSDKLEELLPPLPPVSSRMLQQATNPNDNQDYALQLSPTGEQSPLSPQKNKGRGRPSPTPADDEEPPKVPGYTTSDDAGSDGDDTIHAPIEFHNVPNCIGAELGFTPDADQPETVDLVYNEFIQDWVLLALRYLGVKYGAENTESALKGKSMTDILSDWIEKHWECE